MALSMPRQSYDILHLGGSGTGGDQLTSLCEFNDTSSSAMTESLKRRAPHSRNSNGSDISPSAVDAEKTHGSENDMDCEPATKVQRGGGRRKQSKPLRMCADSDDAIKGSPDRFSAASYEAETFSVTDELLDVRLERPVTCSSPSSAETASATAAVVGDASRLDCNLPCELCNQNFESDAELQRHIQAIHDLRKIDSLEMERDGDAFPTKYHQRGLEMRMVSAPEALLLRKERRMSSVDDNHLSDAVSHDFTRRSDDYDDRDDEFSNPPARTEIKNEKNAAIDNNDSLRFKPLDFDLQRISADFRDKGDAEDSLRGCSGGGSGDSSSQDGAQEAGRVMWDPSAGKARIFHVDAYCELCDREFCNKYFLKTHKANKHGIYDSTLAASDTPGSTGGAALTPGPGGATNGMFSIINLIQQQQEFNNAMSGAGVNFSIPPLARLPMPLKSFQDKTTSESPVAVVKSSRSDDCCGTETPPKSSISAEMEDYCDLCQKHFCNKYYLRKHKLDVHGLAATPFSLLEGGGIKRATQPSASSSPITTFDNQSSSVSSSAARNAAITSTPTSLSHPSAAASMPYLNNMAAAANLMFLNPFASPFGLMPPLFPPCVPGFAGNNGPRPLSMSEAKNDQGRGGGLGVGRSSSSSDMGLQSSILQSLGMLNAEAYMDLCRKEMNNSYMMGASRGQESSKRSLFPGDLGSLFGNGPLNGSAVKAESKPERQLDISEMFKNNFPSSHNNRIDGLGNGLASELLRLDKFNGMMGTGTGLGGSGGGQSFDKNMFGSMAAAKLVDRVVCDICNKEVCNKYFLKTHKIKVHGWEPDNDGLASGTSGQDRSALAQERSSAVKQESSPSHALPNIHNSPPKEPIGTGGGSIDRVKEEELVKMGIDPEAYCDICKKEFCSKYFLKTHRQNIHGIKPVDGGAAGNGGGGGGWPALDNGRGLMHSPEPGRNGPVGNGSLLFTPPKVSNNIDPGALTAAHLNLLAAAGINLQALTSSSGGAGPLGGGGGGFGRHLSQGYSTPADSSSQDGWKGDGGSSDRKWSSSRWKEPMNATRVTCEICSKDLCNKYFLKTHMLKCHGICYDTITGQMISETAAARTQRLLTNGGCGTNDSSGDDGLGNSANMTNNVNCFGRSDVGRAEDVQKELEHGNGEVGSFRGVKMESEQSLQFGDDGSRSHSPMNLVLSESGDRVGARNGDPATVSENGINQPASSAGSGAVLGGCSTVVARTWTVPAVVDSGAKKTSRELENGDDLSARTTRCERTDVIDQQHSFRREISEPGQSRSQASYHDENESPRTRDHDVRAASAISSEAHTKMAPVNHDINSQQQLRSKMFSCAFCAERFSSRIDCDEHSTSAHSSQQRQQQLVMHRALSPKATLRHGDGDGPGDVRQELSEVKEGWGDVGDGQHGVDGEVTMQSFKFVEEVSDTNGVRHFAASVLSLPTLCSITEPLTVTFRLTPVGCRQQSRDS